MSGVYCALLCCLQVLAYSCVYSYYNQETEKMDVMEQQTEALDLHTNALQILLGQTSHTGFLWTELL